MQHYGRLIRVSKYRGDPNAVAYIVAVAEPDAAIALIRSKLGVPSDEIEDLGRVSDTSSDEPNGVVVRMWHFATFVTLQDHVSN